MLQQLVRDPANRRRHRRRTTGDGQGPDHIRELDRRWPGVVIVLPAPERRPPPLEEDYVLQLIRRAIGYQVRLGL